MTCPERTTDLGAYVLGALEPAERRRVEEHVRGCPACTAELAQFAALPALLDRVRPEDLRPVAVTPSPDLFERMSAAAGTRRSRRPRPRALVAAASLVVLGLAAGLAVWLAGSGEQTVIAKSGPVQVTVTASTAGEGSALDVAVDGLWPGETCHLIAVDRDGERHEAGTWPTSEDGDGRWRGWADVDRSALVGLVVLGDGGRELVRVPL
ncbi:MAG TPA: zf-HC2 domain-containing protein [Blastococcus sp.]|nr:zf-HC2 domain-containing protein [Blastococcus sp.]